LWLAISTVPRREVADRLVHAVVAERQLVRLAPEGEAEQLVAEADPERRAPVREQLGDGRDAVLDRGGVAGAVGQEDPVGLQRERPPRPACRRGRR
jgi:hypothetical protein